MDRMDHGAADGADFDALYVLEAQAGAFADSSHRVTVVCDPDLRLKAGQRAPVEAIVHEALDNAVRHAFADGREGRVWISLKAEHGRLHLRIADNGPGFPDLGDRSCPGRELILAQATELGGYGRFDNRAYGGAEVAIAFPVVQD